MIPVILITVLHTLVYAFVYLSISFFTWDINWISDIGDWHPFYRFVMFGLTLTVEIVTLGLSVYILEEVLDR